MLTRTSLGSCLLHTTRTVSPSGKSTGRSLRLWTAMSICLSRRAISRSLIKMPFPSLDRGASGIRSPVVLMVTTLVDGGLLSPFSADSTSSVCIRARRLPLVPTTIFICAAQFGDWIGVIVSYHMWEDEPDSLPSPEQAP